MFSSLPQFVVVYAMDQEMYAEVNVDFLRYSGIITEVMSNRNAEKQYKVAMGKGSKRIEMDCLLVTFCRKIVSVELPFLDLLLPILTMCLFSLSVVNQKVAQALVQECPKLYVEKEYATR